jgi:hypothetical protein
MTKAELLEQIQEENRQWEALLEEIGEERMDQPIAPGHWSIKDIVAHLAAWRRRTVGRLRAARDGSPEPPPPWPAHLHTDDEINAWFHAASRDLPVRAVLADSRQVFEDLLEAVAVLPEAGLFAPDRFAWLEGRPISGRALFGHFHDEHEADMRAWANRKIV